MAASNGSGADDGGGWAFAWVDFESVRPMVVGVLKRVDALEARINALERNKADSESVKVPPHSP